MNENLNPTTAENPDAPLVGRATAGDLQAFEGLIVKYQRAVFNIALYKSRNYFDAEDLTQDVFLAAFKALPSLKAPENFAAWLFGIAYNRCHKWFRREKNKIIKFAELKQRAADEERRRQRASVKGESTIGSLRRDGSSRGGGRSAPEGGEPGMTGNESLPGSAPGGRGDALQYGEDDDHLSGLLKRLPGEIREVLTLKYLEGLSYQEIERRVGINAHRIDYLIRKGKQLLRSRLGREEEA